MKIVYCIDEIDASGGTERITVTKANALAKIPGNEVFLVVAYNRKSGINQLEGVKLIDMDVRYYEDIGLNRVSEFFFVIKKRKEHRKKLKAVLEGIAPDIVVSTGMSEKFFLNKITVSSNPVLIREIHFAKFYRRQTALGLYEKLVAWTGEFIDYRFSINGFDRIIVLTEEELRTNWKSSDKASFIPNPLAHPTTETSTCSNHIVITAGRLERQKNYSSLLNSWSYVATIHPDWHLNIFGKGSLEASLNRQIIEQRLQDCVSLKGFSRSITHEMAESSIFALTSITEGMPLVMIEAMACGLPAVSYASPTGPIDIIEEGVNGFLVPLNDEKALAEKIIQLIEDEKMRQEMGQNAINTSKDYSIDAIIDRWMTLFNNLLDKKRDA